MQDLTATLVQCELAWESPEDNRQRIESLMVDESGHTDLIVLPEMFTTGFSMNTEANAEAPGGETEQWMQAWARRLNCALTGSIAVRENEQVFNRMLFATPEDIAHYDKRHLFRMAGEQSIMPRGSSASASPGAAGGFCCRSATTCVSRYSAATATTTIWRCMSPIGQRLAETTGAAFSRRGRSRILPA